MPMKNPPHPGRTILHDCLDPLGLTVTAGAKVLGVTRPTLSKLINGKAGISPEMAIRLEKAFGSTADAWLRMQAAYDLAQARKREKDIKVERVDAATRREPHARAPHAGPLKALVIG
jgi:addiction module HigA family antidote